MSAPTIRLVCALATLATCVPRSRLHGQGDDSTTRGYAPPGPAAVRRAGRDRRAGECDRLPPARSCSRAGPMTTSAGTSRLPIWPSTRPTPRSPRRPDTGTRPRSWCRPPTAGSRTLEAERKKPGATLSKPERDSLDTQRKAMNRRKVVAEDLVTLADLERDAANKARDAAIARQHALEMEGLFVRKRKESGDNATSNTARGRPSGSWAGRRWWRRSRPRRWTGSLASKRALVASKRLDLFQSYLSSRRSEDR